MNGKSALKMQQQSAKKDHHIYYSKFFCKQIVKTNTLIVVKVNSSNSLLKIKYLFQHLDAFFQIINSYNSLL